MSRGGNRFRGAQAERERPRDTRVVWGVRCTWWDSIAKVGTNPIGLPCCPRCGSVLMERPDEEGWWRDVDNYARTAGDAGYRALIEWMRGKCFPDMDAARSAYEAAGGAR